MRDKKIIITQITCKVLLSIKPEHTHAYTHIFSTVPPIHTP